MIYSETSLWRILSVTEISFATGRCTLLRGVREARFHCMILNNAIMVSMKKESVQFQGRNSQCVALRVYN